MARFIAFLLLVTAWLQSFPQHRPVTEAEQAFTKKVLLHFRDLIQDAGNKMNMNWKFHFADEERGMLTGPDEIDGTVAAWTPHEVRGDYELRYDPGSPESDLQEERVASYYTWLDSVTSAGGKVNADDNPEYEGNIYVQVVVNNSLLSQYQAEGMYADTVLTATEKLITVPGAVRAVYKSFPGSTAPPQTVVLFGEIHFKGDSAPASYGRKKQFSRTDVKHVGLFIHTAPALAKKFLSLLNVNSINMFISGN